MLAIIVSILSSTLGALLNKARNSAADQLKDGDITDEKLRDVVIEDLNDIKKKIDGLSRKDLLASYSFLKEGVVTLKLVLVETKVEPINEEGDCGSKTATTTRNESESVVLNEAIALSQAIQKLNKTSSERFVLAKKHFTEARQEATRAFCNEALSLPDRIMAAQLRVVSKILECLQDTKTAIAGCMLFLEELHNLPAVRETVSTYFKGGIKSRFYKESRLENVKSVLSLNFVVSDFIGRFSDELLDVRNWPRIHLTTRNTPPINPLLLDINIVREIFDKEEFQLPGNEVTLTGICIDTVVPCMNGKGQILWPKKDCINLTNRSGETRTFCQIPQSMANLKGKDLKVKALATDRHHNLFVIIQIVKFIYFVNVFRIPSAKHFYVLFVFDYSGNVQCERVLDFLEYNGWECILGWSCVVNNDGDLIIHTYGVDPYICDSKGELKSRLLVSERFACLAYVTDQNEIVMYTSSDVLVYTKEGKIKRPITGQNCIRSVIFNYITSQMEVLVRNNETSFKMCSYSILSYSEKDEVECFYLGNFCSEYAVFCSHPTGGTALVYDNKIIFM